MAKRQRHTMTSVRWTAFALGALGLTITFLVTGSTTARFAAGYVAAIGAITIGWSSLIIRSTRNKAETRLAQARQSSINRADD